MSKSSVHTVLKDLHLSKVAPKFIPKLLTPEQKRFRVRMCELNLEALRNDDGYLGKFVTGDESWVSVYEVERKQSSCEWQPNGSKQSRPKKALWGQSTKKAMVTIFFDDNGVVLSQFKDAKETVRAENYIEVLRCLKENIRRRRPDKWRTREFLLHHDNAPVHTTVLTLAFIGSNDIEMVPHPPYSPDLAPCDYFIFPRLKNMLRGHRHNNINDMKVAVNTALRNIPVQDFHDAIHSLPLRWMK